MATRKNFPGRKKARLTGAISRLKAVKHDGKKRDPEAHAKYVKEELERLEEKLKKFGV